jgi:hypothetical protein
MYVNFTEFLPANLALLLAVVFIEGTSYEHVLGINRRRCRFVKHFHWLSFPSTPDLDAALVSSVSYPEGQDYWPGRSLTMNNSKCDG